MLKSLVYLQRENVKEKFKSMTKTVSIDEENFDIFQRTWGTCFMIILKATKKTGLYVSLENTVLKNPQIEPSRLPTTAV